MIFKSFIKKGEFPSEWKKANVVPAHKKMKSNCLRITGQPHCCQFLKENFFERIVYNNILLVN